MNECAGCGRELTKDEIALTKKLINRGMEYGVRSYMKK